MPIPLTRSAPAARRLIADEIHDALLEMIVSGELAPGEALQDAEIAEFFGSSRTPVREAFGRLAHIDLVVILPQRGTYVSVIDPATFRDHMGLLGWLSAYAAREATPLLTEGDRAELSALRDRLTSLTTDSGAGSVLRVLDAAYGVYLARYGNETLTEMRGRYMPHVRRTLNAYSAGARGELLRNREEQVRAIDASLRGDAEAAAQGVLAYAEGIARIIDAGTARATPPRPGRSPRATPPAAATTAPTTAPISAPTPRATEA